MASSIEGYPSAASVQAGASIAFHINCSKACSVRIRVKRLGATVALDLEVAAAVVAVTPAPTPAEAYRRGCGWPVAYTLAVPADWASGLYIAELTAQVKGAPKTELFFVVRAATPGRAARILLMTPDTTVQAYNTWGGKSLYGEVGSTTLEYDLTLRARKVSFNRPIPREHYTTEYDRIKVFWRWLLSLGKYAVECCSGVDLTDYAFLSQYQLLLSVGHDEYWSREMRDNVERFVDEGGNVAFFSGNTCYWQVRFEDEHRTLVCYKSATEDPWATVDPSRATVLWAHAPVQRPPNGMMGVGGEAGSWVIPLEQRFTVAFPQHWVFAGTAQQAGTLNTFGTAGYEVDAADFELQAGIPLATRRDGTPRAFVILGYALIAGVEKPGRATLGLMRSTGCVFTAGSVDWHTQLAEANVSRMTQNVLDKLQFPLRPEWEPAGALPRDQRLTSLTGMWGDPLAEIPSGDWLYAVIDNQVQRRLALGQNLRWEPYLAGPVDKTLTALGGSSSEDAFYETNSLFCCSAEDQAIYQVKDSVHWKKLFTTPVAGCTALAIADAYVVALAAGQLYIQYWEQDWAQVPGPALTPGQPLQVKALATSFADVFVVTTEHQLFHHPLQSAEAWEAARWTLLDSDTNVDYLAAVGGRLYGFEHARHQLWTRDQTLAQAPLVATYDQTTGAFRCEALCGGGRRLSNVAREAWAAGWTHLTPFAMNQQAHLLAYNARTGAMTIVQIAEGGRAVATTSAGVWRAGWTHLVPFTLNGEAHLLVYQRRSGAMAVERLAAGGLWRSDKGTHWAKAWTHITPFTLEGQVYFWAYHRHTGQAAIEQLKPGGQGTRRVGRLRTWAKGWTQVESFTLAGQPYLFTYNARTGAVAIEQLAATGRRQTTGSAHTLGRGFSHVRPFVLGDQLFILGYQASTGFTTVNLLTDNFTVVRNCYQGNKLDAEATALCVFWA